MPGRRNAERPGARLARSYLVVRAEQSADRQPREVSARLQGTVRLPQLQATQLNSPEAHAQYRLAVLARLATGGAACSSSPVAVKTRQSYARQARGRCS
jgi:uncharacterized MAPEG superfamily protein